MRRFFATVVAPLLEAARPARVVEIGAFEGGHSRPLARWCKRRGARLEVIDPEPRFDAAELERSHPGVVRIHRAWSLEVLGGLLPADVVLIDGDHNWYTVFHELRLLYGAGPTLPAEAPIAVCHDVGWPFGRRDAYFAPDTIPAEYRHPWERGGMRPDSPGAAPRGYARKVPHAVREGGPRNGVRTAIEDAFEGREGQVRIVWIDVLFGLAILVPEARLATNPELVRLLDELEPSPRWRALAQVTEYDRILGALAEAELEGLLGESTPCPAGDRSFASCIPGGLQGSIQKGALGFRYKGRRMLLHPFDLANYLALLDELRPGTVFEIGTFEGGRSLWLADTLAALGCTARVVAVDLVPPAGLDDPRILALPGNALDLARVLDPARMGGLPGPYLVIEDSAHDEPTSEAVLRFFDRYLRPGDRIVVEDGGAAALIRPVRGTGPESGPSRAIARFLADAGGRYAIDAASCDRFGYNATGSPNGWLRRL